MKIKIRKAKLEDKEEIMKLVRNLYLKSAPKMVKKWKRDYNKLIKITLVAGFNKKIIAFLSFIIRKTDIYIGDLYVLPEYRRKSIATKLIKKIDCLRKKLKKRYLMVNNRKKDKPALRLYKKLGFQIYSNKNSLRLRK